MTVKGYTFGLKSIVHNIDKIYAILLENLQYEDSWHLLQAVIKDTKAIRFDMWLRSGLAKLVGKGEPSMQEEQGYKTLNIYGRTFN